MYKLLVVDDEPVIVEGMADIFRSDDELELEVYQAGTAMEALKWLERTKIDIVLSDIRMPGMSGLELQREIHRRWPRCKVIFLTGYGDFQYAQTAIRHHGFDYLLKTDGADTIVRTVKRAVASLQEETASASLLDEAKKQLQAALPALQKQYLREVLEGHLLATQSLAEQFEELQLPLSSRLPVLLLVGRMDDWEPYAKAADRALMLYAIQNIAAEYLQPVVSLVSIAYDRTKLVWLMQPKAGEEAEEESNDESAWTIPIRFVHGTVEQIQQSCRRLLKLQVSFSASSEPVPWEAACAQFDRLQSLLTRSFGVGRELLLTDARAVGAETAAAMRQHEIRQHFRKLDALRSELDSGHREAFFRTYKEIEKEVLLSPLVADSVKMEMGHAILALIFSFLNRLGEPGDDKDKLSFARFARPNSWEETAASFTEFAETLFERQLRGALEQEHRLVRQVREFIESNLAGDLSLTRIGEVVAFNPSYLSRIYKQITGEGLSDYIAQVKLAKTKELLAHTALKIHDISLAVGFEAPAYFYRFFKKATNMTPQEYRESVNG